MKDKKNIAYGIQRLKALLGMDDKPIQELGGKNIDKENMKKEMDKRKLVTSNDFIRDNARAMVKL